MAIWKICLAIACSLFLFEAYKGASFFTSFSNDNAHRPTTVGGSWDPYGSFVMEGPAVALPSIRISPEEDSKIVRNIYGGKGDKAHLGGFTAFDEAGVSLSVWKHMVTHLGIKSLLDLGCGRGVSTSWFVVHGLEYVVCAEGSHDAITQNLIPKIKPIPNRTQVEIVEHDFSRGPWWPSRTVVSLIYFLRLHMHPLLAGRQLILSYIIYDQDAVWCVEVSNN